MRVAGGLSTDNIEDDTGWQHRTKTTNERQFMILLHLFWMSQYAKKILLLLKRQIKRMK